MEKIVHHFYKNLSNFLYYINGKENTTNLHKKPPFQGTTQSAPPRDGAPYSAIASRPASAKRKSSAQTDWARKQGGRKKNVGCVYSIYFLYVYEFCDMNNVCFMYIYIYECMCLQPPCILHTREVWEEKKRNAF